jgi:lipid-A-disaccharide synthase
MSARRVFITVADVSGDQHAAELIRALHAIDADVVVEGIGGPRMLEAGANVVYESVGAAAMGLRGATRAFEVIRLIRDTRRRYEEQRPDLHVCIDSSAMNLPFAKMAQSMGVPVLYYIAPQLWASRERRIKKMRRYVDRVACILPFEEQYYRSQGVDATFVGHPLFDKLPPAPDRARAPGPRFPQVPPVVGIVPGSRRAEVRSNLAPLLDVTRRIRERFGQAKFLVPTTEEVHDLVVEELTANEPRGAVVVHFSGAMPDARAPFTVKRDAFDEYIPQCDLCLCKSGTSTLHVAAYGVPMVVVYRVNPIAWHGVVRWLVKTRKIALVNILAGNVDLVPEFIPWYGSNDAVADTAIDLLEHPEKLAEQRRKLEELVSTLDRRGASMNAARIAIEMMNPNLALAHV